MKRFLSVILTVALLLCAVPAVVAESAGTAAEYIYYASGSSEYADNTAVFTTSAGAVGAAGTNSAVIDSVAKLGYEDKKAVALTESSTASPKWAQWNLTDIPKGTYEIYYWNIPAMDDAELYRDTATKPTVSREIYYDVIRKVGSSSNYTSTYFFDPTMEQEGWVKIGDKFSIMGDGTDAVRVGKYADSASSYAYINAIRLVSVEQNGSDAELSHVYLECGNDEYWATDVVGDEMRVRVPNGASWFTVTAVSADPEATITIDGAGSGAGRKSWYLSSSDASFVAGDVLARKVTVTSADGQTTKSYTLAVDLEGSEEIVVNHESTSKGSAELIGQWAATQAPHGNMPAALPAGATLVAHLELPGYGVKYTPEIAEAGWYNVYSYAVGDSYGQKTGAGQSVERQLTVSVQHNGLTKERVIANGGMANAHNASGWKGGAWIYAGRYYFNAQTADTGTQNVTVSKLSASATSRAYLYGIKLVKTQANTLDKSLDGITVNVNGQSLPILGEYADGYALPMPAGDYTTVTAALKTANQNAARVTVNGAEASDLGAVSVPVADGENQLDIVIEKQDGSTEEYSVTLYKQTRVWTSASMLGSAADTLTLAGRGAGFTGSSLSYLKPYDGYDQGWKPRKDANGTGYTASDTQDDGYYRVMVWKPAVGAVKGSAYPVSHEQTVSIHTGYSRIYKTIDWAAQPSRWVDLGLHCMKFSSTNVDITFDTDESGVMVDLENGLALLKVNVESGLDYAEINTVPYAGATLDGMIFDDADGVIQLRPVTSKNDDTVTVNGEAWPSGETLTYTAEGGMEKITIQVTGSDSSTRAYSFVLLTTGELANGEVKYYPAIEAGDSTVKGAVYYRSRAVSAQPKLLLAQYKGTELVAIAEPTTVYVIDGARKAETEAVAVLEGVTMVKAFLWEDLDGIAPLAAAAEYPVTAQ